MPKLVPIDPKNLITILLQLDFVLVRIKGSHHIFSHKESGKLVVDSYSRKKTN
jgi:predicted RNA binding protein YcfA (HicA-like mRNA interferase family)